MPLPPTNPGPASCPWPRTIRIPTPFCRSPAGSGSQQGGKVSPHPAARSEGEQGRNFTPPSPPWAQWAAGMDWRWSRGSNLVTGPLGSVAREPDRRQRQLLCLLPVQVAGAWQVRRCVCAAHMPWPQMQVHAPAAGVTLLPAFVLFSSGHGLKILPISPLSRILFLERGSGKGQNSTSSAGS
jgi:hypothetical protein